MISSYITANILRYPQWSDYFAANPRCWPSFESETRRRWQSNRAQCPVGDDGQKNRWNKQNIKMRCDMMPKSYAKKTKTYSQPHFPANIDGIAIQCHTWVSIFWGVASAGFSHIQPLSWRIPCGLRFHQPIPKTWPIDFNLGMYVCIYICSYVGRYVCMYVCM
jgi:hypothetical protein